MSLSFVVFDCFFFLYFYLSFFLYFYLSFFLYFSLSFPCLLLNNRFLLLPPPASTCLMRKYKNGISSSDGKKHTFPRLSPRVDFFRVENEINTDILGVI